MDFDLNEDQSLLRDSVERLSADLYPSLAAAYPGLTYGPTDPASVTGLDVVFLAMPHGASRTLPVPSPIAIFGPADFGRAGSSAEPARAGLAGTVALSEPDFADTTEAAFERTVALVGGPLRFLDTNAPFITNRYYRARQQ